MKSIVRNLSLAVYGFVFFISCTGDDEGINVLLGAWTVKATTTQNCKDPRQNITTNYVCDNAFCDKYIFNPDGLLKVEHISDGTMTMREGTYTISNSTVVTNIDVQGSPTSTRTFTCTVTGSTLYLQEFFPMGTGKCSATTVLMK